MKDKEAGEIPGTMSEIVNRLLSERKILREALTQLGTQGTQHFGKPSEMRQYAQEALRLADEV